MIVKDTPRNLEFLKGNSKGLTPMTHEEAVLAGTAEPLNVNEVNMKNASGGGSLEFIKPTISVASTSAVGSHFTFPVCMVSGDLVKISNDYYNENFDTILGFPRINEEGCTVQFEIATGFAYESVSGSGYSVITTSESEVHIRIKSSDSVIRIKCVSAK